MFAGLNPAVVFSFSFLAIVFSAVAYPAIARAQTAALNIQQYQPTPFSDGYLRVDGTEILPRWKLHVALDADYAWKPLVLVDVAPTIQRSRKTTYDFIGHAVGADLAIAMGVGGRFEVGALVPVTAFQTGDDVPGGDPRGLYGLGNAKLGAKARILGSGTSGPGLGASLLVSLPWGLGGAFTHDTAPAVEGRLFGQIAREQWSARLSGGYRAREAVQLFDITVDDELTFGAGGEFKLPSGVGLLAEIAGGTRAAHPFNSSKQTPVELLLGARREVGARWIGGDNRFWLTAAAGPGLTPGYGSPEARVVVSLAWSNRPVPHPPEPWAPPPKPPEPPKPPPPPPPVADRDKDGIPDDDDECPDEPEDKDGFEDEDGCPDPDNDKDGIPDAADKCPNEPETINGIEDDDGCPDKGETAVHIGKEELETLKPIFFETDHSRVRHAYYNILGQIALTLKAHPEVGRCAVEGHTDDTGPPEWNQKLSVLRAEAVVEFLVDKGVERSRLTAIGRGEKLPWAPNDTEEGRAKNRRVIFHIEGVNPEDQKREERRQLMRARKTAHQSAAPRPADDDARTAREAAAAPASADSDVKTPFLPGATKASGKDRPKDGAKDTATDSAKDSPTTGAKSSSIKTTARPPTRTPDKPEEKPKFIDQRQPNPKKPAPPPETPNTPKTLRDLLRLPER